MDYGKFAVIPTHNRPLELDSCLRLIGPQVEATFVIDNASYPPAWLKFIHEHPTLIICDEEQPPNLSRLWNAGLKAATRLAQSFGYDRWYTAILNDDALPPPGWMDAVVAAMEETGAAAGCSHPFGGQQQLLGPGVPASVGTRLTGWAFVLRQPGLDIDERFRWLAGDDDLSTRARQAGGIVYVEGFSVPNTLANTSTNGVLAEQGAKDMQSYVDKWGHHPWGMF